MARSDHRALPVLTLLKALDRITVAPTRGDLQFKDHTMTLADLLSSAVEEGLFDSVLPTDSTLTITDRDGTTLYTVNVPNGSTLTQAIDNARLTVRDEAGLGGVLAEGSYEVILNNSSGQISSSAVSVAFDDVAATCTITFSDFTIRINGTSENTIPFGELVGVNLQDANGTVPYISTSFAAGILTLTLDTADITVTGTGAPISMGSLSPGDTHDIDIQDTNSDPVAVTKISNTRLQIDDLPALPNIGRTHHYHSMPQSQKEAGFCSTDYWTLDTNNYYGNTLRFTGKTGGGYDGTNYVDVSGSTTTYALAYPDDMILIHDIPGERHSSNYLVLCMYNTIQPADTYANHITDSDALTHGGIGPNRWFLPSITWFFQISRNRSGTDYVLDHPPFNGNGSAGWGSSGIMTTDDETSLNSTQTISYRSRYNQAINRNKTGSDTTVFFCWYDCIND